MEVTLTVVASADAVVTSRVATGSLVTPSNKAVTFVVPADTPVARPEASTVATAGLELSHVAVEVTSDVLPSLKLPVAVNCWV